MTRETYGEYYQRGFNLTIRFLISKGVACEDARETAQAAWAKGWERLSQLRNETMVVTWVNTIALNVYRSIRRKPSCQSLPELSDEPHLNLAAIDVERLFRSCKVEDRQMLSQHYLEGMKIDELATRQGRTETAVRIRLLRARRSAKALLDGTAC